MANIMTDQLFILYSVTSLSIGFILALYLGLWLEKISWWKRVLIQSTSLALFLGIGIAGGGGEPGFALPAPVIPVFFFSEGHGRLYNAIYPFLFWWAAFFAFFLLKHIWKQRTDIKMRSGN